MNPEVQCCIHKGPPIIPILSWINPIPHISLRSILILSSHLCLGLPTKSCQIPGPCVKFLNEDGFYNVKFWFLQFEVVSLVPNPQAGGLLLVYCPWLLIHYICCYPPYLEAYFPIRNPRDAPCHSDRNPRMVWLEMLNNWDNGKLLSKISYDFAITSRAVCLLLFI